MTKIFKYIALGTLGCTLSLTKVFGFALLGPFDTWQTPELNYQLPGAVQDVFLITDLGGPQDLGEEYRWTVPVFYYGVDASFLNYFGLRGKQEVDKAVAILNAIPNYSSLSETLSEYPLESDRMNYQAAALGLYDMKSMALSTTVELLGVANPERYVWTLRGRDDGGAARPQFTYYVINRNFDPVTWEPSRYVNGVLYTFRIMVQFGADDRSDAQEQLVDPSAQGWNSVAGAFQSVFYPGAGAYYNGLTRDDIGGLRYIYRKNNYNVDGLGADVLAGLGGTGGSPWSPVTTNTGPTNVVSPNNILRQGVDRIEFVFKGADTLLGTFYTANTNRFSSVYLTNGIPITQSLSRVTSSVDLLYYAYGTSGGTSGDTADSFGFRGLVEFVNSQELPPEGNGTTVTIGGLNGPGFMLTPDVGSTNFAASVGFFKSGPSGTASGGFFVDESTLSPNARWGSFDGTTNAPVVYPSGTSIKDIENQVLGGSN